MPSRSELEVASLRALLRALRAQVFVRDEELRGLQESNAELQASNLELLASIEEMQAEVRHLRAPEEGLGGTPWCLDDEEVAFQATNAWLPVVSFGPATPTREEFTPINEVDGEVWVARGWRLGTSSWGWQEEEWVPYQAPSADEVALVARDARVLAYEVEQGYDNSSRALRPTTNMAVAGRFIRAALRKPSSQGPSFHAAEAELKELQDTLGQDKVDQAAARHATNSQMRQAGMADRLTRHTEVEEEEEEEFVAQEAPVQGHQNRRKKSDGEIEAERWCHDAFDKLWGLEEQGDDRERGMQLPQGVTHGSQPKFRSKSNTSHFNVEAYPGPVCVGL